MVHPLKQGQVFKCFGTQSRVFWIPVLQQKYMSLVAVFRRNCLRLLMKESYFLFGCKNGHWVGESLEESIAESGAGESGAHPEDEVIPVKVEVSPVKDEVSPVKDESSGNGVPASRGYSKTPAKSPTAEDDLDTLGMTSVQARTLLWSLLLAFLDCFSFHYRLASRISQEKDSTRRIDSDEFTRSTGLMFNRVTKLEEEFNTLSSTCSLAIKTPPNISFRGQDQIS